MHAGNVFKDALPTLLRAMAKAVHDGGAATFWLSDQGALVSADECPTPEHWWQEVGHWHDELNPAAALAKLTGCMHDVAKRRHALEQRPKPTKVDMRGVRV